MVGAAGALRPPGQAALEEAVPVTRTTYRVRIEHPRKTSDLRFVKEVALANGEGYSITKTGVIVHELTEHGLERLERERWVRFISVTREPKTGGG